MRIKVCITVKKIIDTHLKIVFASQRNLFGNITHPPIKIKAGWNTKQGLKYILQENVLLLKLGPEMWMIHASCVVAQFIS